MEQNVFPVPTQEKVTRWCMYGVAGIAALVGVLFVGPLVLTAVNTLFGIVHALIALGVISVVGVVGAYAAFKLSSVVKGWIDTLAYKANDMLIDGYPIIQMKLWRLQVLSGTDETNQAKSDLSGIVGQYQGKIEELQTRVKELQVAIRDKQTSAATRNNAIEEIASKSEVMKPYERVVAILAPAVQTLGDFVVLQERYASKLQREIDVASADVEASESITRGLSVWSKVMGRNNQQKLNYEAARDRVKKQMGDSLGRLADMRTQMGVMLNAAASQDEVAMANARKYVEDSMRTIEVPFVEVQPTRIKQNGSFLNLN